MGTDKPLISILMAVYEPRMDWLEEQLDSLNAQTYPRLRLYLRDDCSPTVPFDSIKALAARCITAFPYTIERNEENLGSNGTFQRLTQEAEGDCFAYCDQDDIWLPEKLCVLAEAMEREHAELVCSDMYIIDEAGRQVAGSMTKVRRHHVFRSGAGLAPQLLFSNFATGCAMLVRAEQCKAAIPFCPEMVHDHYLALWCAAQGTILSIPDPLIRYRIHAGNQTPVMAGVKDKESYCRVRIESRIRRLEWLKERFQADPDLAREIDAALVWARARRDCFRGDRRARGTVLRYRRFSPLTSLFEAAMAGAPERIFMFFIMLERRNFV